MKNDRKQCIRHKGDKVKVSVLLICYRQEKYIKQALESILSQKTDFEWELLIGDDASPDNTADLISQCIQNPPENCTVDAYLRETNLGASKNLFDLIRKAKGEYLTVLEGDDYWLYENRLQTLVDFLDSHKEYVGVSYRRERRREGELIKYDPEEAVVGKRFSVEDYYDGKRFSAMACLFRNIYCSDYDAYEYMYTGARNACDQVMCYTILFSGDIFVLDKVFGVYRIDSGGYCSHQKTIARANDYLIQNRRIAGYYGMKPALAEEISVLHSDIMKAHLRGDGLGAAIAYYGSIDEQEKKGVLSAFGRSVCSKLMRRRK